MTDTTETSETVDATAATDTTQTADTETILDATADQETSTASETNTTEETVQADPIDNDAKPAEQETVSEDKPADRVIPDVDGYVLPEGMPIELAQFAKDTDMTQDQLDKTLAQFDTFNSNREVWQREQIEANGQAHVKTWGKMKDQNLSIVRRALSQNDPEGKLKDMLNESGYGSHPAVLDFFLQVGNSMKEGGFLKGANNTQSKAGLSAAQSMFADNHPSNN